MWIIIIILVIIIIIVFWQSKNTNNTLYPSTESFCISPNSLCMGAQPTLTCSEWNQCECNKIPLTGRMEAYPGYYWKHPNRSFFGYNLAEYPLLKDNLCELARICNETPGCVAYESSGKLKSYVMDPTTWSVADSDIYVKQQVEKRI